MCLLRELLSRRGAARLLQQFVALEFFSKCAAVDAENTCGLALVAVRVVHDDLQEWPFHFTDDEVVEVPGAIAIERLEIGIECVFSVLAKRLLAGREFRFRDLLLCHFGPSPKRTAL